jgi:hypothetical protein
MSEAPEARTVTGRKPKQESRSVEFRQKLIAWKQMPALFRPSLRALARELGTSHQLLMFYLKGLEKWEGEECLRRAKEIRALAKAEDRPVTPWEEQRILGYTTAGLRALTVSAFHDKLEDLKRQGERGPLHRAQIKMTMLFAHSGLPGARELLQKCSQRSVKNQKNNLPASSAGVAKSFKCA